MPRAALGADEIHVLDNCDRLVDLAIWPRGKIDYRGWMANFDRGDRPIAARMLGAFTFLSHDLVDQLFRSAFHDISNQVGGAGCSFETKRLAWDAFGDEAIVVPVMGETPSPADSGWGFARKARQLLGIGEARLLSPFAAVAAVAGGSTSPIVFVDDFVGSGDQFLRTWRRRHHLGAIDASFEKLADRTTYFYCNVLTTEYGRDRIRSVAPEVRLVSGNIIPAEHNHVARRSHIWHEGERMAGLRLARRTGRSLGYTRTDGGLRDWRGYHRLGLGIAMEDAVPDANLPIFFEDANGWRPLVRRS